MTLRSPKNDQGKMVHAARLVAQPLALLLGIGMGPVAGACDWSKLDFDPTAIDARGLIGPAGGKRLLDYEFCAPANGPVAAYLRSLSPPPRCRPGAVGRSGCGPDQALCIGYTGSPDWLDQLCRISEQPSVNRIRRVWWEH
jgi:hypothetical protein